MDVFSSLDLLSSRPTPTTSEDEGIPTDDFIGLTFPVCIVA